jgi:ribose transport system substrate-binding protein
MKKRAFATLAVLVIGIGVVLSAAGCGTSSSGGSTGENGEEKPTISVVGFGSNPYYAEYNKGFEAEAKKLGLDINIHNSPSFEAGPVTATINAAVADNPDYLLVAAVESTALRAPLLAASERGIKIITYDTQVDEPDFVTSYVNANYGEYGEMSGAALVKLVGGKGKVLLQLIIPGNSSLEEFTEGFEKELPAGIEMLPLQYSGSENGKGNSIMRATLTRDPDLAGVVAFAGFGGEGAIAGLEEAGKAGTVKAVMTSATKPAIQLLEKGSVQTVIAEQLPKIGEETVKAAYDDANGKTVPKEIDVPLCTITKETIGSAEAKLCEQTD